jgi:hypothetical protein
VTATALACPDEPGGYGLELVGRLDHLGYPYTEVRWHGQLPSLAEVGYGLAATTLAEPLRQAFRRHLDDHGCGTGDHRSPTFVGGFAHCPAALRLYTLLPDGDQVAVG